MMKIIIPLLSITIMSTYLSNITLILSTILMLILISSTNSSTMLMNTTLSMDSLSMIMIILSIMSSMLIFLSSYLLKKISKTMIPILIILTLAFSAHNMINFYILFEIVLIPTMILITMNGKQPERLQASIYLMIYTIMASLPLLVSIIYMKNNMSFSLSFTIMLTFNMSITLMLAFLVKMPMYFFHLWLPKAHVEAPLEGSMILAAILLKLGGYGLIRFIPMCLKKMNYMNPWIISICFIGATATSMNCIRQKDLKSLIAYSSVAHMGLVLMGLFSMNFLGLSGAIIMMIAHGMSSSALFMLTNDLYTKYSSRNILSFKGMWSSSPNIVFWWFIFMAINISAPPSINTISEIFLMSSLINWNNISLSMLFITSLMTTSFSLIMFINISHNKNSMSPSIQTQMKIYLSLLLHMVPLILLLMKMEMLLVYKSSLYKTMVCGTMHSYIMYMSMLLLLMSMTTFMYSLLLMNMNTFISMNMTLMNMASFNISINILLDWISMLFLATVMFISSMILMFSMYYIPKSQQKMFFLLLIMFILSMSILILSNNIFLLLLGWDGLGLSSYALVIFYQNFMTAASGSITLLSNRIGDIMILFSISMLFSIKNWNFSLNNEFPLIIMIMIMLAASSKSAQYPFSAWLPMAMAAPTPISALVHSSTLVTAGVFLLIRTMNNIHPFIMLMLMMISSATTLYASLSANWEQDLKKMIALSTLSQIAMMMFAISINAMNLAFLHLIIHAIFKSTMFLCAGIMIHETSYQDTRMMGMSSTNIPLVSSTLGITSMALMGIPFLSSFFSKDIIIEKMISSKLECILSLMMITSIALTTMYSTRMSILSNKFLLKTKPDTTNHHSIHYNIPLLTMNLMTVTSGMSFSWTFHPEQSLLLPTYFKLLILLSIMMTLLITSSFINKMMLYIYMGESSISLWFNHIMSTMPVNLSTHMMSTFMKNDSSWQEMYGPYNLHFTFMKMSKFTEMYKYNFLMILLMITLIPIMLM